MPIKKGDKAPGLRFTDHQRKEWNYPADFESKVAFFFLRHLGCPLCKEKVEELKDKYKLFEQKGVKLFAVVQSTPKRCARYAQERSLPYCLVSDREKKLYGVFGVEKGGIKEFTAPAAFKATVRATLKGHMHGWFEGDELQVPGAFLLSPDGMVLYAHYGKDVSDFGEVESVLAEA